VRVLAPSPGSSDFRWKVPMQTPVKFSADELGAHLVEMSILTAAQWDAALSRAGGPAHLGAALDGLTRTPAYWATEAAAEAVGYGRPLALTPFQVAQLVKADGDYAKLGRLLRWNDYLLIDTLGKGGMGVVYKGWDLSNRRYVAIKRTHREGAEARKRLRREAALQKHLDHPNIAKLYSREKLGNADLLVLEYLPGLPLNDLVAKRKKEAKTLPWAFVAEMGVDLLDALDHAHGRNPKGLTVVHRDIKPANVMLMKAKQAAGGEKYVPKLLDMGLAKSVGEPSAKNVAAQSLAEGLTEAFQILGTPEYMPPEQWAGGGSAIPESDTYALGGTLYFALTGQHPFPCKSGLGKMALIAQLSELHAKAERPSVAELRPDVPVEFDRLIRQMLAVAPSYRGQVSDLREQLRGILAAPRTASRSAVKPSGGTAGPARSSGSWANPSATTPGSSLFETRVSGVGSSPRVPRPPADEPHPLSPGGAMSVYGLTAPDAPPASGNGFATSPRSSGTMSVKNVSATAQAVRSSARNLFDDSTLGSRKRMALGEAILEWAKQVVRPRRNPIPLLALVALTGLAGWVGGTTFALFFLTISAIGIGFAFVLTQPEE
jgi:serine/threonine protein kinase